MPRPRSQLGFDMFPFLSVLCSVIGVLMLLIAMVASTRVLQAQAELPPEPPKPQGVEDGVDDATYRRLEAEMDRLTGELATRLIQRDALLRRERELIALLEAKTDAWAIPQPARHDPVELDHPDRVAIVPDERWTVNKRPIRIEVHAEGYVVHPQKLAFPPVQERGAGDDRKFDADRELRVFLETVDKNRDREYLLLLVHPNGVGALKALREYLLQEFSITTTEDRPGPVPGTILRITRVQNRINVGVEPFSRDWLLITGPPEAPMGEEP
ncbi:MAG TPA: hypothetical protein VML55_16090 [Planctomycetaceae bacterium]|nr:hypothetical protein [Planctomycetaceae bacterium]